MNNWARYSGAYLAAGLLLAALCLAPAGAAGAAGAAQTSSGPKIQPKQDQAQRVYHGNLRSRKFHRPGCRYYWCKNCKAVFKSREEAIKQGYVPCKVCKP